MSRIKYELEEQDRQSDLAISLLRTQTEAVARARFLKWTCGNPTAVERFEAARLEYNAERANE